MSEDIGNEGQRPDSAPDDGGQPEQPATPAAGQDSGWSAETGAQRPAGGQWWTQQSPTIGYPTPGPHTAQFPPAQPYGEAARARRKLYTGIAAVALVAAAVGGGIGVGSGYLLASNSGSNAPNLISQPASGNAVSASPGSVQYAAQVATKSTVDIQVTGGQEADEGTGIVLTEDGYILTNNHVISSAANGGQIQITLPGGQRAGAKIIGTAPSYDLAVIKVDASGLTAAQLGQSGGVQVGQPVAAIGSPYGLADTVTSGIVSALNRTVTVQADNGQVVVYTGLQTDAPINPGNSGGPLVNMDGQVIGVNSSISTGNQSSAGQGGSIGLGFSIPIDTARRVANDLIHNSFTTKPILGVVGDASAGGGTGAQISGVQPGSAAADAGLQAGDTVTAVNGRQIQDYADLMAQILDCTPNQNVTLSVKGANGSTRNVQVTLGGQKDTAQTTVPNQDQSPFSRDRRGGGLLGGN